MAGREDLCVFGESKPEKLVSYSGAEALKCRGKALDDVLNQLPRQRLLGIEVCAHATLGFLSNNVVLSVLSKAASS